METRALELMGRMIDAFGPSGFEREINRIVKEEVEPIADEIITDKLGSVAFKLNGDGFIRLFLRLVKITQIEKTW